MALTIMYAGASQSQTRVADLAALVGRPADIAGSAYLYRADRKALENPPEAWLLMIQHAGLSYTQPADPTHQAVRKALCGLLWEEVRPVRRVELSWPADAAARRPAPGQVALSYFDATDKAAHTWWNPRTVKQAGKPKVQAGGRTYVYTIPVDTWGVVASVAGEKDASAYAVPAVRAFVSDTWKRMDIEVEWGFEDARAKAPYGGRVEPYDAIVAGVRPLDGDSGTTMAGAAAWKSAAKGKGRRGVRMSVLYMGTSRWRKVWPYHARPEDVARSIITVRTRGGSFSFLVADLELGPILAPEYGFFVRATGGGPAGVSPGHAPPFDMRSQATSAREFIKELKGKGLSTVRQRTRKHPEQTWEGAVAAMRPGQALPPHPKPPLQPAMQIDVPCKRLTAQWKLGAWHILRRSVKDRSGKWSFNDYPFGILAAETYMILRALDIQGMHKEAADGLDQWLRLPMNPKIVPGKGGHHGWAPADRPLGHFSDGKGCMTHAQGPRGIGGHMDAVHSFGPGAIMFSLAEHYALTGDREWLKKNAPRMKAHVQWILRQRQLLTSVIPGGKRLWSKGLQPAHVVTPDSECMYQQYYESEAYYWLAVKRLAGMLADIEPDEAAKLEAQAEAYRKDLAASVERSIALTPVVAVRDGTYRSFIPFAPYVRGFASGAWGWRRCGGHVGAIYWDTVQSADPLISPSGLLPPRDARVQGHLDVLEDRLLLENPKVAARTPGFDAAKHWFAHGSFQYQCGLERHANIHLLADDCPNYIRSMLNQYAVDIMPGGYTFREHTTGGPPDKIYEESCFIERFRMMLLMETGRELWLARATPRAWLEQGRKISVRNAPTHFGAVAYEIVSDIDNGKISATVELPSRVAPKVVLLRLRHPKTAPIAGVTVNGKPWREFSKDTETIALKGLTGKISVVASY